VPLFALSQDNIIIVVFAVYHIDRWFKHVQSPLSLISEL